MRNDLAIAKLGNRRQPPIDALALREYVCQEEPQACPERRQTAERRTDGEASGSGGPKAKAEGESLTEAEAL